jgi:hypothetical protein
MRQHRSCLAFTLVAVASCCLVACGASSETVVRVGDHAITKAEVGHWMSVLVGYGTNGRESPPPVPVPPRFEACIADPRAHRRLAFQQVKPTREQLKADCKLEYERFKLKALYLLISYQWVSGAARELGVKLDRQELAHQLSADERALAASSGSFERYLRLTHATRADVALGLKLNQLTQKVEAKVGGASGSTSQRESLLVDFGKKFKRRWLARTDCRAPDVVPICRQYRSPATPPKLVPPSVPLTHMPSGG